MTKQKIAITKQKIATQEYFVSCLCHQPGFWDDKWDLLYLSSIGLLTEDEAAHIRRDPQYLGYPYDLKIQPLTPDQQREPDHIRALERFSMLETSRDMNQDNKRIFLEMMVRKRMADQFRAMSGKRKPNSSKFKSVDAIKSALKAKKSKIMIDDNEALYLNLYLHGYEYSEIAEIILVKVRKDQASPAEKEQYADKVRIKIKRIERGLGEVLR